MIMRKIVAVDGQYAHKATQAAGARQFPARGFLDQVRGGGAVDVVEALYTVVEYSSRDDVPEEIASQAQSVVRRQHAFEDMGYRVIRCATKPSASSPSGFKQSDDQRLMITTLALTMRLRPDFVVLVAGDGDYAPLVWQLREDGIRTEVVAHPESLASELRRAAFGTIDLARMVAADRSGEAA